jgi:hypothetical protein
MGFNVVASSTVTFAPSFSYSRLISHETYCTHTRREARTICVTLLGASLSEISLNDEVITQLRNVNQQNALFYINVLIQFFLSSACFEHRMFVIRKNILYIQPYMTLFPRNNASSLPRAHPSTW